MRAVVASKMRAAAIAFDMFRRRHALICAVAPARDHRLSRHRSHSLPSATATVMRRTSVRAIGSNSIKANMGRLSSLIYPDRRALTANKGPKSRMSLGREVCCGARFPVCRSGRSRGKLDEALCVRRWLTRPPYLTSSTKASCRPLGLPARSRFETSPKGPWRVEGAGSARFAIRPTLIWCKEPVHDPDLFEPLSSVHLRLTVWNFGSIQTQAEANGRS
jgi:hypothetical protein